MTAPGYAANLPITRRAIVLGGGAGLHALEVGSLLYGRGFDDLVVAAGVLHDARATARVDAGALAAAVGDRVAALVAALTPARTVGDEARWHSQLRRMVAAGGPDVHAIHAADVVSETRELRAAAAFAADDTATLATVQRIDHYVRSLELLERVAPRQPLVHQLRFELWALARVPASVEHARGHVAA